MSESVRVDSIDALKQFRIAIFKFAEACKGAMSDADSDMHKTLNWLENEQPTYWQTQGRKRAEMLARAKEALRMKTSLKDSTGRIPRADEEEKAVRIAMARVEEAEQKLASVKKSTRVLQREIQTYKGQVQRFATTLESDLPLAAAMLDSMVASLEAYVTLAAGDADVNSPATSEATPPPPEADLPKGADGNG